MKLRSLAVNQFKKFTSPTRLDGIDDGLNVIVGPTSVRFDIVDSKGLKAHLTVRL